MRCLHESQCHEDNSFITLTYDDDHLPSSMSLDYVDFQLFMKRLRKEFSHRDDYDNLWRLPIRFFMCGEYGEKTKRPHYHACLFGVAFTDRVLYKRGGNGISLYTSEVLKRLWPMGHSLIGDVTFESAAYVARYCVKKITGVGAEAHYRYVNDDGEIFQRTPEFTHMSLKPGIGAPWYNRFSEEVYPRDEVIVRGKSMKPPKYYDNLLEARLPEDYEFVLLDRYNKSFKLAEDATPARLRVRETVARATAELKRRNLE